TPVAGVWIDRFGPRLSIVGAMLFSSSGALLTLIHNVYFVIIGLAICSAGIFMSQSCTNSFIGDAATRARASATGLYLFSYYLGGSAGGVVAGYFWKMGGWPSCVAIVILIQCLTSFLALVFWNRKSDEAGLPVERGFDQEIGQGVG